MAVSTKAIKQRIKSVNNTKKITKAMEMVAASKMRRIVEKSLASREYAKRALELLVNISRDSLLQHPLLQHGQTDKTLLIIVAADKGLCGGFNVNVFKELKKYHDKHSDPVDVICVGRYAEHFAKKLKLNVIGSFVDMPDNLSPEDVRGLSRLVLDEYLSNSYNKVRIVYTNFISAMSNEVDIRGLLPVTEEHLVRSIADAGGKHDPENLDKMSLKLYKFEPDEEAVLDRVLPILTEVQIYQSLLESRSSEYSSRMVAMKSASENAEEMVDDLTLSFNKARQASITQEILEIASGAQGVN